MPSIAQPFDNESLPNDKLIAEYERVRAQTMRLTEALSAEDMMLQSMPDASPAKWPINTYSILIMKR